MQKLINLESALNLLESGKVIIVPTDTIPGLAVDATNEGAINKIYKIKKRDKIKTLPLLFSSLEQVEMYFKLTDKEKILAKKFWPGGLTLVLKPKISAILSLNPRSIEKGAPLPKILQDSAGKIGVRIPNNRTTIALINLLKKPIAATSINISGEPSITKLEQIPAEITAQIAGIIAGNYISKGVSSTVAEVNEKEVKVYREGAISSIQLNDSLSH